MKARYRFATLLALALASSALGPRASWPAETSTPSARRPGPHGLQGWTLDSPVAGSGYGDQRFAFTLVVARRGHVIRRIGGKPIIWRWRFWADGREVAYETGPLHFGVACYLVRLADGRRVDSYDCYRDLPPEQPDWVKALEAR